VEDEVCEYCGCQTLSTIDELTREHDVVIGLIGDVRAAAAEPDLPRMAGLARRIAAVLGPHTQVEEHGLFPALAASFPDHIATLEAEHRRFEAVLAEASAGVPADPAWQARLAEALRMLRAHIFKEQDGVFPAALASLKTADWEAAEAVRARAGSLLPGSADMDGGLGR
jgi:hypothetical protein